MQRLATIKHTCQLELTVQWTIKFYLHGAFFFSSVGFVELDLHRALIPTKTAEKCNLEMVDLAKHSKVASLFEQKSMKGWWPCYAEKDGNRILAVSILMDSISSKTTV